MYIRIARRRPCHSTSRGDALATLHRGATPLPLYIARRRPCHSTSGGDALATLHPGATPLPLFIARRRPCHSTSGGDALATLHRAATPLPLYIGGRRPCHSTSGGDALATVHRAATPLPLYIARRRPCHSTSRGDALATLHLPGWWMRWIEIGATLLSYSFPPLRRIIPVVPWRSLESTLSTGQGCSLRAHAPGLNTGLRQRHHTAIPPRPKLDGDLERELHHDRTQLDAHP